MEIKCSTCRRLQDERFFALDTTHVTGHARVCRVCHSVYARQHYQKNRAKTLVREKQRYANDPSVHLTYLKEWRKTAVGKASRNKELIEQRKKFPEKYAAYQAVQRALRTKKLVQGPCSVCGSTVMIHAHHEDYSKPFEVIWLCRKHHQERHKELKSSGNLLA